MLVCTKYRFLGFKAPIINCIMEVILWVLGDELLLSMTLCTRSRSSKSHPCCLSLSTLISKEVKSFISLEDTHIILLVSNNNICSWFFILETMDQIRCFVCWTPKVLASNLLCMVFWGIIKSPARECTVRLSNSLLEVSYDNNTSYYD